jgi:hypothetical protein
MKDNSSATQACAVCRQAKPIHELTPAELVRPSLHEMIRRDCPDWNSHSWICRADLRRYTGRLIENMLTEERGELSSLDVEVLASLRENELTVKNINEQLAGQNTLGERVADRMAEFGGSWRFVLLFMGLLAFWVVVNSLAVFWRPIDPYPFIFFEPDPVLHCGPSSAHHHDEPEPSGKTRPLAGRPGLQGQSQGRVGGAPAHDEN